MAAAAEDGPVLVAVISNPLDLARARDEGWYRIPLLRAPQRIAADYLAFYQTGAFPPGDRWIVRWMARVTGYRVARRCELIPEEPDHPRANDRYYRIAIGSLTPLASPIVSRRLRRITFIATTLSHLNSAKEINDLWMRSPFQERLWAALQQAELEAERQYPLVEDSPQHVADFAVLCRRGGIVVFVVDEPQADSRLIEQQDLQYALAAGGWPAVGVASTSSDADIRVFVQHLKTLVADHGGLRGQNTQDAPEPPSR